MIMNRFNHNHNQFIPPPWRWAGLLLTVRGFMAA
jgi:hypothetical protein